MKLVISDYCLAPKERVKLSYKGKNPFGVCKAIPTMLIEFLEVPTWRVREKVFKWDFSGDIIDFYVEYVGEKPLDLRSTLEVSVKVHGKQSKTDKRGKLEFIKIKGTVTTTYELASIKIFGREVVPLKSLVWIYHKLFYNNQRLKYIQNGRRLVLRLANELKGMFGLLPVMA